MGHRLASLTAPVAEWEVAAVGPEGVTFEKPAGLDHAAGLLGGQKAPVAMEEGSVQAEQAHVPPLG